MKSSPFQPNSPFNILGFVLVGTLFLIGLLAYVDPLLIYAQTTPAPPTAQIAVPPTPTPSSQVSLFQRLLTNYRTETIAVVVAIITAVLTMFFKSISEWIRSQFARLFHFLFDRFASVWWLSWRYEKAYRYALSEFVQDLASSGIVEREVKLEKVYVPVDLTEEMQEHDGGGILDRLTWDDERRKRQRERAISLWEATEKRARLVVLGQPGAGKTTCLYHMAYMCATNQKLTGYTPIFMRLRDLVGQEQLEDVLPTEFKNRNFPNAEAYIKRRLAQGRCLLLLDGLDELDNQQQHQDVVDLVQNFANRYALRKGGTGKNGAGEKIHGNRIIVSCRTYSYAEGKQLNGFAKTLVMDFSNDEIQQFVYNWYSSDEARDLAPLTGELYEQLRANRRFLELARNPLLLLLIADHYERDRELPRIRAELYQHCIRTRITRWNTVRGTHRGRFGETNKWRMLRELALHLFQHGSNAEEGRSAFIPREDLLEWVEEFAQGLNLGDDATATDLFDEVARTSGLIQERTIGKYGFSHQTLQEYFAAEAVDRLGADEGATLLSEYFGESRWNEVILLYCGLADNADPLLRRLVAQAEAAPDKIESKTLWLQAGYCWQEGARHLLSDIQEQITAALFNLLVESANQVDSQLHDEQLDEDEQNDAIEILGGVGGELLTTQLERLLNAENDGFWLASRLMPYLPEGELREQLTTQLTEMLDSEDEDVREMATSAIGRSGANADSQAVDALRRQLRDDDADVRQSACQSLARLQAVDGETADTLLDLCANDRADGVRHQALYALLATGEGARVNMVQIPAGEFLMGSNDNDQNADKGEKPQHRVYLPDYFIDRTPVTNAQFRRFVDAGGYEESVYWQEAIQANRWADGKIKDGWSDEPRAVPEFWDDAKWNGEDYPVVGVTWYEAMAYARWAGKQLPSEAQWEKAARGTDGRIYPWGNHWDAKLTNTKESKEGQTTPVERYADTDISVYGAIDMSGNVNEWCNSQYKPYPFEARDGREDFAGDNVRYVLRGGSFADDKTWARCARRYRDPPWDWRHHWGFRCIVATSS